MRTINKESKQVGFIFSVFNQSSTDNDNLSRHEAVLRDIILKGIAHKPVQGSYTHADGTQVNELSLYIETNDKYNELDLFDYVKSQCINANQESFLHLDISRNATLYPLKGESQSIGVFTDVSETDAKKAPAFTYCPTLETYFICK